MHGSQDDKCREILMLTNTFLRTIKNALKVGYTKSSFKRRCFPAHFFAITIEDVIPILAICHMTRFWNVEVESGKHIWVKHVRFSTSPHHHHHGPLEIWIKCRFEVIQSHPPLARPICRAQSAAHIFADGLKWRKSHPIRADLDQNEREMCLRARCWTFQETYKTQQTAMPKHLAIW